MTTHNTVRVACDHCRAHGEVWDDDLQRMKPCGECLSNGWLLEDRLHIPSPNPNPDMSRDSTPAPDVSNG